MCRVFQAMSLLLHFLFEKCQRDKKKCQRTDGQTSPKMARKNLPKRRFRTFLARVLALLFAHTTAVHFHHTAIELFVCVLSCFVINPSAMTSPADKKNQETPRRMPPVLFPTRRFAIASRGGMAGTLPSASFIGQGDDSNAVQWIGMNPLEMITHLARATEEAEVAKGISAGPICVGETKLSSETPPIPQLTKSTDRQKKKRGVKDTLSAADATTEDEDDPYPLPPWDLSFLLANDEYASDAVKHLQFLAYTVESMPQYALVGGSYQRIRDHVAASSSWIHASYSGRLSAQSTSEKMSLLHNLYAETIQQMTSLVEMTRMLGPMEKEDAEPEIKPELPNREFAEYMTMWLKKHWTNPYPDDAGLEMMANDCGKTITVVSNWLINARTRKWRPSIVKAFELKRPANLLLEDSINLFDGEPLRDLTEYEASQVESQVPVNKRRKCY